MTVALAPPRPALPDCSGKIVAIVAMGDTIAAWCRQLGAVCDGSAIRLSNGAVVDQVWALNHVGGLFARDPDLILHMDDMRVDAEAMRDMFALGIPIVTSTAYPEFPNAIPYPLATVLNDLGLADGKGAAFVYLDNIVAYAIALALWGGARAIACFGCDFQSPTNTVPDEGHACAAWWAGFAQGRGTTMLVPVGSRFLGRHLHPTFYGYRIQPDLRRSGPARLTVASAG